VADFHRGGGFGGGMRHMGGGRVTLVAASHRASRSYRPSRPHRPFPSATGAIVGVTTAASTSWPRPVIVGAPVVAATTYAVRSGCSRPAALHLPDKEYTRITWWCSRTCAPRKSPRRRSATRKCSCRARRTI
jgi:hypothetical protein